METRQLKKLKSDLLKFEIESIEASNSDRLKDAVQTVITAIDEQLEKSTVTKKAGIISIISLLDSGDIEEVKKSFPQINYIELEKAVNSRIDIESLNNYTIIQLKVIYYMLTHDKENNAIKTSRKELVLNSVKEVIFNNMRAEKLKNM